MLIIQHIWTKWTKASRGANAPLRRPQLAEAYELPEWQGPARVLSHELRSIESEEFRRVENVGEMDRPGWGRQWPWRETALDWRDLHDEFAIILTEPSPYRRQTKWPARLPSPLFTLRPGETARIDWNGRFRRSLFGSNRASYYERHTYWLGVADRAERRLFLDAEPRKRIDLTTGIY